MAAQLSTVEEWQSKIDTDFPHAVNIRIVQEGVDDIDIQAVGVTVLGVTNDLPYVRFGDAQGAKTIQFQVASYTTQQTKPFVRVKVTREDAPTVYLWWERPYTKTSPGWDTQKVAERDQAHASAGL